MTAEMPIPGPHISLPESLGYMDEFLHWSDILDVEFDQTDFSARPTSTMVDPCHFGQEDSNLFSLRVDELGFDLGGGDIRRHPLRTVKSKISAALSMDHSTAADRGEFVGPIARRHNGCAPFLLKNLREKVIVLMEAMPLGRKSPWNMMNMQAAVVTLGDLTFLNSQNIAHARLANLYGLLACSAFHLTLNLPNDTDRSIDHWKDITNQAFEQAKGHMQNSLKNETQVPKKVKYKDQLMALSTLTEFAIISGQPQHARCFLLDTERLVRPRGFTKRKFSQKARLLHHVYTWHRIVGESTYVLHDYSLSKQFLDALQQNFQPPVAGPESAETMDESSARIDNFLRLETHSLDRDLNIHERKDQETSLRDIHLEVSRDYPETLYKEIYGIPETWLSLISQTTRLANVMETFRNARGSLPNLKFEAWDTLHRRSVRLEYMICSLNRTRSEDPNHDGDETPKPDRHMLRALNAALAVFFYRRIYQVHPQILRPYVDDVITGQEKFWDALQPVFSIMQAIWAS